MIVRDQKAWDKWVDNNQDCYGGGVINYAERWANFMEEGMKNGSTLETIAKDTSHQADTDGITGFMYGAAVAVLASCWEYGEELRTWHNLDTQIKDEGEKANEKGTVLNPALLTIKV